MAGADNALLPVPSTMTSFSTSRFPFFPHFFSLILCLSSFGCVRVCVFNCFFFPEIFVFFSSESCTCRGQKSMPVPRNGFLVLSGIRKCFCAFFSFFLCPNWTEFDSAASWSSPASHFHLFRRCELFWLVFLWFVLVQSMELSVFFLRLSGYCLVLVSLIQLC